MKKKAIQKLGFIVNNTIRQTLISLIGMVIPFLVIHFSSKEIWGEFVSVFLFVLMVIQIINWGNKEYLLRKFSETPSGISNFFSENLATRFPLVLLFWVIGFGLFPISFSIWILAWLIGRFLSHSVESLITFDKEFNKAMLIELLSFTVFCLLFYFFRLDLTIWVLLVLYSLYQFFRGLVYFFIFRTYFDLSKAKLNTVYFKSSFSFFLLSFLGFLTSKIDVYIVEGFLSKKELAEYQIINGLMVFVMSVSAFIYSPFTKNIYRNNKNVIKKTKEILALMGLVIIPMALLCINFIIKQYLKADFPLYFYFIAFLYIYPSYIYGLDIVNLFRLHKEKTVVKNLIIGVMVNTFFSALLLYLHFGIAGALCGSAIAQNIVLILFKAHRES